MTVRRGNQTEPQTQRRQFRREAWHRSLVDLRVNMFFQLCDYAGFIDIVTVSYELLGQIDDTPVELSGSRKPRDTQDIQITYEAPRWDQKDDTFSPRYRYLDNNLGRLSVSLGLREDGFLETVDGRFLDADIAVSGVTVHVQGKSDD